MWTCGKNFGGEGLQRRGRGAGLYGGGFVLLWFIAFPIFDIA